MPTTRVIQVGLGGFGQVFWQPLLDGGLRRAQLVAAVDPGPLAATTSERFAAAGVPIFTDLSACLARVEAELVVIAAPIALHRPLTEQALAAGRHVLCEKPAAGCRADAEAMAAAAERAGRRCAIGFQWSYEAVLQELKRGLLAGRYGRPERIQVQVRWPRGRGYFARNDWAGRWQDAAGRVINDSPATNAMAHFIQAPLWLLGDAPGSSASVHRVTAERYRCYPIETFDTVAADLSIGADVPLQVLLSHASRERVEPTISIRCSEAELRIAGGNSRADGVTARFSDGRIEELGCPWSSHHAKLDRFCALLQEDGVDPSPVTGCLAQLSVVDALAQRPEAIVTITETDRRSITDDTGERFIIDGLDACFDRCAAEYCLPQASGLVGWSRSAVSLPED